MKRTVFKKQEKKPVKFQNLTIKFRDQDHLDTWNNITEEYDLMKKIDSISIWRMFEIG